MQSDQHLCYSPFGHYNSNLVLSKISIFYLVSMAEQVGLVLTESKTLKKEFLALPAHIHVTVPIEHSFQVQIQ